MWFKLRNSRQAAYPEEVIRHHSLSHLAEVFGVSEASLFNDARFGHELKAAPASDFRANEFDVVDGEIKAVADKQLRNEMAHGLLVIETVGDYCEHMLRCSAINPKEVARILRLPAAM